MSIRYRVIPAMHRDQLVQDRRRSALNGEKTGGVNDGTFGSTKDKLMKAHDVADAALNNP